MKYRQTQLLQLLLVLFLFFVTSCKNQKADLILINGLIHTMNDNGDIEQAIAMYQGKIIAVGMTDNLISDYQCETIIDLQGKPVFPGFIDAHCHFYGYATNLNQVDLVGTTSYEEVISKVDSFGSSLGTEWIQGRGWDQNDWEIQEFPTNRELNKLFPTRPVLLRRVDGHAAIANAEALKLAGFTSRTRISGGFVGVSRGRLTGVLLDNAVDSVMAIIPGLKDSIINRSLELAQEHCFSVGLTTLDDAGLEQAQIARIDSLQQNGDLKIRIYAMANASQENLNYYMKNGPVKTDLLNVRSFKAVADGALGSRGACMLEPYNDQAGYRGFILKPESEFVDIAKKAFASGFQLNTHCIGDSANRMMLRIYGDQLKGENDYRWRIEHAQVLHPGDFSNFGKHSIIPSVQPTHATSDMYWAVSRIGRTRLKSAYAYQALMEQNGLISFGSDFPVEHINPIFGFYAAVVRKDLDGRPFDGFQPEQKVSREDALRAMTIWAAYSNFEEKEKGSLETGKYADLVVLDQDLMFIKDSDIPKTKVLYTIVNGEIVFSAEEE